MDQVFVLIFGRRCSLRAGFLGLNSMSVMESLMLRSGALLHDYSDPQCSGRLISQCCFIITLPSHTALFDVFLNILGILPSQGLCNYHLSEDSSPGCA